VKQTPQSYAAAFSSHQIHQNLTQWSQLTRFVVPTLVSFNAQSTQVSEAESCEDDLEERLPILFWPPPSASQSIVSDSLDWDPAGVSPALHRLLTPCELSTNLRLQPVLKRSDQHSVFAVADQKVKEELFKFVQHYRRVGMMGSVVFLSLLNRRCAAKLDATCSALQATKAGTASVKLCQQGK
jgi:hypothetical protein